MNRTMVNPNRRILVIDDVRTIQDDFRKILGPPDAAGAARAVAEGRIFGTRHRAGFEIDAASQGEEGLEMLQRSLADGRPYAMAFVDMRMPPGWDGIETTKRLWQACPELQIVICTAFADCSWDDALTGLEPQDRLLILKKPFDPVEVQQMAGTLTEKWRLRKESELKLAALEKAVSRRTCDLEESQLASLNMMEDAVRSRAEAELALADLRRSVAEREKTEAKLVLLNTAMMAAPNCVMITDEHGRIEWVNPAFTQQTGYSAEELIGRNPRLLKSGHQPPEFYAEMWRTITSGQHWRGEFINRRKDGQLIIEDSTIAPVHDATGAIRHFVAINLDVTASKAADRRLREQAELLDRANEAIVVADLEHRVTFWNRGAELLLGWASAETIGRPLSEILTLGGDGAELRQALSLVQDWHGELRGVNRRGERLTIETRITLVRDDDGHANARLCISSNVTEKKNLEERFLRAQRLESVGMLAAGIAHDLNNVLAPIRMAAPMLRDHIVDVDAGRLLDTLEKCTDRGAGLVRQILSFAHGASGEPRLVQVKHVLRDIAAVVGETFPKRIVLEEQIPNDLWPVLANPTQIHQVLLNLCVNARDAMPLGGTLRLSAENCLLDADGARVIEGARPGAWLMLRVEDTGTGIPPDVLAHMWEPFFTTKADEKGTGLGLSTVRGIVETHRGFITVETADRRGSTFRVYLPAAEAATAESEAGRPPPPVRGSDELILIAEDESSIRELAATILTEQGYRVVLAADGIEAAAHFASRMTEYALVITDHDMPRLDGAALAGVVRHLNPTTKILSMSGASGGNRRDKVRPVPFAGAFIAKPFTADAFVRAVQALLIPSPARTGNGPSCAA